MLEERRKFYEGIWPGWRMKEHIADGSGGTSVYKISRTCPYWQDGSQEEVCALKIIPVIEDSIFSGPDYEKRRERSCKEFAKEVWNMYQVRGCTNVVTFSDYDFQHWTGKTKRGTFLAIRMDYLETLCQISQREVLKEKQILNIGIDICKALVQCHAKQIVHRDIKPQNIFRTSGGVYMLGDFGIAKMLDIKEQYQCSTNKGSAFYAAPEQFHTNYGLSVDIYSLGLVLYELLKGQRPFEDECETPEKARNKRIQKGCVLPEIKGIRSTWNRVLRTACAYEPEKRYATARDFLNALEGIRKEINFKKKENNDSNKASEKTPEKVMSTVIKNKDNDKIKLKNIVEMAKDGNAKAQYELSNLYYEGKEYGINKDDIIALRLCKSSARQGYIPAQVRVGIFYYKGICTEKNDEMAFEWFKKCVESTPMNKEEMREQGKAQYYLAIFYEYGLAGLEQDSVLAYQYYEKAKQNGYKVSKK